MSFFNGVTPQSVANAPDNGGKQFSIGDNFASIRMVEEKVSNSGNQMLVLTFKNKDGAEIKWHIVDGEYKLSKLKSLYQCFNIPLGNSDIEDWRGRSGIVVCREGKPYNGIKYPEVHYLRPRDSDGKLPPVRQPENPPPPPQQSPYSAPPPFDDGFADDIPF